MMYQHFNVQKKESSSRKQGSKLIHDTVHSVIQECNGTNNLVNFYYVFIDQASQITGSGDDIV